MIIRMSSSSVAHVPTDVPRLASGAIDADALAAIHRDAPYGHALITRPVLGEPVTHRVVIVAVTETGTLVYSTDPQWVSYLMPDADAGVSWERETPADTDPAGTHTPRTYTARRVAARFFEYVGADDASPGEHFNIDATPHTVSDDAQTFDRMADLVAAVRRDCVTFDATGAEWASDPDGSQVIDYGTGERETVSWHFDGIAPAMLARVIVPAVDAR